MEEFNVHLPADWQQWNITEFLGEGAHGKVYKAEKRLGNFSAVSAIKIIEIPSSSSGIDSFLSSQHNQKAAMKIYTDLVEEYIIEIQFMESLKGITNIVSIEDYYLEHKDEELFWRIYIRMEYLQSLSDYQIEHPMSEEDAVKLGKDLCTALQYCKQKSILHRDIKPENVFVSDSGDFKLGDFGVARKAEQSIGAYSFKGSYSYMAPEVYKGEHYGSTIDIYSVGMILYRLLNRGREPFVDPEKQIIGYQDLKIALDKRMAGDSMPTPIDASPALANVILTAVSYQPDNRYASPELFSKALDEALKVPETNKDETQSQTQRIKHRSRKWIPVLCILIALICASAVWIVTNSQNKQRTPRIESVVVDVPQESEPDATLEETTNVPQETTAEILSVDISSMAGFIPKMTNQLDLNIWVNKSKIGKAIAQALQLQPDDEQVTQLSDLMTFSQFITDPSDYSGLSSGDTITLIFSPDDALKELLQSNHLDLIFDPISKEIP